MFRNIQPFQLYMHLETAISGRQKIFSTMIIHVLHFKFKFEFLESMENVFDKMIEKLLDRNKNTKQKASRFSKRSADRVRDFEIYLSGNEVSKHTPISFET